MNLALPALLLGLGVKCVLGWALLLHQRSHVCTSFLGVFGATLSAVDTAVTLVTAAIHLQGPAPLVIAGLRLTSYNTCLLVQILGEVCNALHWPVVLVAALDRLCAASLPPASPGAKRAARWLLSALLWTLAVLYVFLLSGFNPVLEDAPYWRITQCWVSGAPPVRQVAALLSLLLACVALHALRSAGAPKSPRPKERTASGRSVAVARHLRVFLSTWSPLLVLLAALLLLLPEGIPSFLGLNAAWLCLLNSALIALVLCATVPGDSAGTLGLADVLADSFCEWSVHFSPAAGDRTGRHRAI